MEEEIYKSIVAMLETRKLPNSESKENGNSRAQTFFGKGFRYPLTSLAQYLTPLNPNLLDLAFSWRQQHPQNLNFYYLQELKK